MSGKALRRIQKSLNDLYICKDRLVVPRTPYKGLFYFWRVLGPLYSPVQTLPYSSRLVNSDYISLDDSEMETSVRRLVEAISGGELEFLRSIRRPEDFLEQFGGDIRILGSRERRLAKT